MKRIFYLIFTIGILIVFGREIFKPEINISRNEQAIYPVQHTLPTELEKAENLSVLFYDGEYAVFTENRDMENQRIVGPASETSDLYVYKIGENVYRHIELDLFEGIVTSAVFDGINLYYAVNYPYAGRAEVVMDDDTKIVDYKVYELEYEAGSRMDNPLEVGTDGDDVYFTYRRDNKSFELYLIEGQIYNRYFSGTMQAESGNYSYNIVVNEIGNTEKFEFDYRTIYIDYAGGHADVDISEDNKIVRGVSNHYWPSDWYIPVGHSVFSLEQEGLVTTPYKALNVAMGEGKLEEKIGLYSPIAVADNRKDMLIIYSDDGSTKKTELMEIDRYKISITPVDIEPDSIIVSDDNAVFMIKENGVNKIYTLK